MTDAQLAAWLGIGDRSDWQAAISGLSVPRRVAYERLAAIECEVNDWLAGRGPKPIGVLLDFPRRPFTDG